jgi:outer membrane protein assembly factor BamD
MYFCIYRFGCKFNNVSKTTPISSIQNFETPQDSIKNDKEKKKKRFKFGSNKVNFETFYENYDKAVKYYNKGSYLSAAQLFEQLYPLSIGTKFGDSILFMFADCYFQNRDYQLAAFHFKDYSRRYPGTERTELAALNCVKALYYVSPSYDVDQSDTKYAIEEIKQYVNQYPNSKYIEECNVILDELRDKLARKQFEVIKLYYNTGNYKATQIMVRDFMKEYSYSKYAPEALFLLVTNNYEFANKSVESKKKERYLACAEAYDALKVQFPDSKYLPQAKKMYDFALKQINIINSKIQ